MAGLAQNEMIYGDAPSDFSKKGGEILVLAAGITESLTVRDLMIDWGTAPSYSFRPISLPHYFYG